MIQSVSVIISQNQSPLKVKSAIAFSDKDLTKPEKGNVGIEYFFGKEKPWLHLLLEAKEIHNKAGKYVIYTNALVDSMQVLFLDSSGRLEETQWFIKTNSFTTRAYPFHFPAFAFSLHKGESKKIIVAANKYLGAATLFFQVKPEKEILLLKGNTKSFIGFVGGVILLIVLFICLLYFFIQDQVYLWYLLYIFSSCFYLIQDTGIYQLLFPEVISNFISKLPTLANGKLIAVFLTLFLRKLLGYDFIVKKDWLSVLLKVGIVLNVLMSVVFFIMTIINTPATILNEVVLFANKNSFILVFALLALLLKEAMNKNRYAIIYIIISIPLIIGMMNLYQITHFEILTGYFGRSGMLLAGLVFEIVLLTFVLVYNFYGILKEKESLLQKVNDYQTQLVKEIVNTQETERSRLARDLHDDLGATLSTLKLHLSNPPKSMKEQADENVFAERGIELISKATDDLRQISHDLLPNDFIEQGLFNVLQQRIHAVNKNGKTRFALILEGEEKKLDTVPAITLYRIINEMISNIIHHAQASEATVQLSVLNEQTQLIVEDNGIGFSHEISANGIGLKNIHARVGFLKGNCTIDSSSRGTTFIIDIPVNRQYES